MTTSAKSAEAHFRAVAPKYMRMFMEDFDATAIEAAAVFGNAGYESLGFTKLQEMKPTVAGSRGGWGWFQWTGPRRKAFEAYCARNGFDPASDEANYKFLFVELIGSEKGAVAKLKAAKTLEDKVKAFELAFERAGVKAYEKRNAWALIALDALRENAARDVPSATERPSLDHIPAETLPPLAAGPVARPGWLPGAVLALVAIAMAAWVWWTGRQGVEPAAFYPAGAPVPLDRPVSLFGGPGSSLAGEIGWAILMSFIQPIIAAAATYLVGWVVWLWGRVLKTDFDKKSADQLHAALERGILAAVEHFGAFGNQARITSHAADYVEQWNAGTVKRLGLTHEGLQELALPHLARVKRR